MELHLAPPPQVIAEQAHLALSSAYWLVPDLPVAVDSRHAQPSDAVKLLVADDRGMLEQHGRRVEFGPAAFTWFDPGSPHRLSVRSGRVLIVRFSRAQLRRLHPLLDLTPAVGRGTSRAEAVAARLFTEVLSAGQHLSLEQRLAATRAVTSALGLCAQKPSTSRLERHVAQSVADIGDRLREPSLQVASLAQRRGISRRLLDRAFVSVLGVTAAQFIRAQRLEGAAKDLQLGLADRVGVGELGRRWGFDDASHFGRAFRQKFGQSPGAYRSRLSRKHQ